jgi:hypothetical protein
MLIMPCRASAARCRVQVTSNVRLHKDFMPSLKPLRSVAHNVAHSFASTLNYWIDDYAISHLWKAAKFAGASTVKIDVLALSIEPKTVNTGMVPELLPSLRNSLNRLLEKEGVEKGLVIEATLEYDFSVQRVSLYPNQPLYNCKVMLGTRNGRTFTAQLTEANN